MSDLLEYWFEVLDRDIRGFADPHSEPKIDISGRDITVAWHLRDHENKATFHITGAGDFRWRSPTGDRTYLAFLSSPAMADLGQLSSAVLRRIAATEHYVSTQAHIEDPELEERADDSDVILKNAVDSALQYNPGKTKVIFIKGDAGAGKTTLLEYITKSQSRSYSDGSDGYLYFYVSAQGRALSNLRDAFAAESQNLRAAFTWHSVAPLTRNGILVPIIDGFDELLGAAGYGDAFGSLKEFLAELDGKGVVIVSARSSFYDVEFVAKYTDEKSTSLYDLTPIVLHRWSDEDIEKYVRKAHWMPNARDEYKTLLHNLPERDRNLLGKPFFASRFTQYADARTNKNYQGSLIDFLIESYTQRESQKIVDRDGNRLLSEEGHGVFFEEAADLMWVNESRRLSATELRILAELVAEQFKLSSDAANQFVAKVTSYAGFSIAAGDRFAFEHEIYFDYFLSKALRKNIMSGLDKNYLDRGILPDEIVISSVDSEDVAEKILRSVFSIVDQNLMHDNRRRNAGSLFVAACRIKGALSDFVAANLEIVNGELRDVKFKDVKFVNCTFHDVNFSGTKFFRCEATKTKMYSITVSDDTVFDIRKLEPGGDLYSIRKVGEAVEIYSPKRMLKILGNLGAPFAESKRSRITYSKTGTQMIALLERVAYKYARTNVLCVEEDPGTTAIAGDPLWPQLKVLLIQNRVVREEVRPTSGRRKYFLRPLVSMPDLMSQETKQGLPQGPIGDFWRELRALKQ